MLISRIIVEEHYLWFHYLDELYIRIDEAYGDMDNAFTKAQSWSVVQI